MSSVTRGREIIIVISSMASESEEDTNDVEEVEEDTSAGSTESLTSKAKTKAKVWQYFGLEVGQTGEIRDINTPICRIGDCHARVKTKHSSTTNLYSHLKQHHPKEYEAVRPKKDKSKLASGTKPITEAFKLATKLQPTSHEHKELTKAVTYHLAKDMRPLSTVELPGFKMLVSKLNPRYELPSRNYSSRTAIPSLYSEVREGIERKLSLCAFYSATTDMWTSGSMDPYISFTIHYISNTWDMCSHCLSVSYLAEDHTAENIKLSLLDTLTEWNLKLDASKLVAVTTDSGANIKRACSLLQWKRISCFGHNLDLAVQKSLQDDRVSRVLRICRQIVAKFSQSWKKVGILLQLNIRRSYLVTSLRLIVRLDGVLHCRW